MEAFSDGVFAIAITLLVLELEVPERAGQSMWEALGSQWPSYLAYLISFATVGAYWIAHNAITDHLDRVDAVLLRLNLLLLLSISFMPFPTKLVAQRIREEEAERVAVSLYGVAMLTSAVLLAVLWRYARSHGLLSPDLTDELVQGMTRRLEPGVVGYVVVIVASYLAPLLALVGYLVVSVYLLVPLRRGRRRSAS